MSPAHVLEPTYQRLKQALRDGLWRYGAKLEAMRLAEDFGVSMTPVRDCLNQLVGEGLVDLVHGRGFRVASLTEKGIRDLLEVNELLLVAASRPEWDPGLDADAGNRIVDYPERLAAVFSNLASASGNRFTVTVVNHINDRLHPVRKLEPGIVPGAEDLLHDLEKSLRGGQQARQHALHAYHRHIIDHVSRLMALAER